MSGDTSGLFYNVAFSCYEQMSIQSVSEKREVNKNNLLCGQFKLFLPHNQAKYFTGWATVIC